MTLAAASPRTALAGAGTGAADAFGRANGLRYGLLGLPLAFVALPLYVLLPNHYAREFGLPLAALGIVLLAARLLDALVDPLVGRWADRLAARSLGALLRVAALAAALLAVGFALLFFPPVRGTGPLLAWLTAALAITYLAFSTVSVAHQAWGAMLGGDDAQRSRIVGWREGLGVAGVLLASVAPALAGLPATAALFALLLAAGIWAWAASVRPQPVAHAGGMAGGMAGALTGGAAGAAGEQALWLPLERPAFRRLLVVFLLNGIASAIPATLVLFFIQDRLQAPAAWEPAFLGLYFLCAAASIPVWLALVRRHGLARSWLAGMLLSVAVFVWTATLGTGDAALFLLVCALSGVALGADLAVPGALLAGVIGAAGDRGRREGAYFGWWNFAAKLNLALAAGLALPLLGLAGYAPGARGEDALWALTLAYCLLPCVLKLAAAGALWALFIKPGRLEPSP